MRIKSPKLWCAAPDLEPGTVMVEWNEAGRPRHVLISGEAADDLQERFRAAPDATARHDVLVSAVSAQAVPA